jgi:hypothetical protein
MKNGDFNRRAQFQRRKELKQENEIIRSLLLLPCSPSMTSDARAVRGRWTTYARTDARR